MSPARVVIQLGHVGFPRVSGDEPAFIGWLLPSTLFSPRERG